MKKLHQAGCDVRTSMLPAKRFPISQRQPVFRLPLWITGNLTREKSPQEWTYFRKTFAVSQEILACNVKFASSGICGLYVNGRFIEAGTSRWPGRVNYHEITGAIQQGNNVITLKAGSSYFFHESEKHFTEKGCRPSAKVYLNLEVIYPNGQFANFITDHTWKTLRHEEGRWPEITHQDSHWEKVRTAGRLVLKEYRDCWEPAALWMGVRKKQHLIDTEFIRPITGKKYFENISGNIPEYAYPVSICRTRLNGGQIRNRRHLLSNARNCATVISRNESAPSLTLDFGTTVVGYVKIAFGKVGRGRIRLRFDYTETWQELENPASRLAQKLEIFADIQPGIKEWFNLRRRAFRFLQITFENFDELIQVKSVSLKYSCYPVDYLGWFSCSDRLLENIWKTGRHTLHVNMHQEYESCPRNEMHYFSGDGRIDALVDFYVFGDGALAKSSLSLPRGKDQDPAYGIMSPEDGSDHGLWDYPAWRIISILDYFLFAGDIRFLRRHYADCRNRIEWLIERQGLNGLIYQLPIKGGTVLTDWTCTRKRWGETIYLNCLFYKALADMTEIAGLLGKPKQQSHWRATGQSVKKAINRYLWRPKRGVYHDRLYDYIPQDGNVLAILFGVADRSRTKKILKYLKSRLWSPYGCAMADRLLADDFIRGGAKTISPLMNGYEAECRFIHGDENDAIELIRRCWGTMLKKGARTFWEFAPNDPSKKWPIPCHAWSAGATYCLSAYVLGIRPLAPGFRKVIIAPQPGNLKWVKGCVSTPNGLISISYRKGKNNQAKMEIFVPEKCLPAEVLLPGFGSVKPNVYLNGSVARPGKDSHSLPEYRIKTSNDREKACFTLHKAGRYIFTNYPISGKIN